MELFSLFFGLTAVLLWGGLSDYRIKNRKPSFILLAFYISLVLFGGHIIFEKKTIEIFLSGKSFIDYGWRAHSFGPMLVVIGVGNSLREIFLCVRERKANKTE